MKPFPYITAAAISLAVLATLPAWAARSSSAPPDKPGTVRHSVRVLKFPDAYSAGMLTLEGDIGVSNSSDGAPGKRDGKMPAGDSTGVAKSADNVKGARLLGQARGEVKVPADGRLFLKASPDLTRHPEALDGLPADALWELSFKRMGFMTDIDPALSHVARLTGLHRLNLDGCDVTDAALTKLKTLINLEALSLWDCGIRGTCLKDLKPLTHLRRLTLANNTLDPAAYSYIAQFPNLKSLSIARTRATDRDVAALVKLKNLDDLKIADTLLTKNGLESLRQMEKLEMLDLNRTPMHNLDVLALKGLKILVMHLPDALKPNEEQQLKAAFPKTLMISGQSAKVDADTHAMFGPLH